MCPPNQITCGCDLPTSKNDVVVYDYRIRTESRKLNTRVISVCRVMHTEHGSELQTYNIVVVTRNLAIANRSLSAVVPVE